MRSGKIFHCRLVPVLGVLLGAFLPGRAPAQALAGLPTPDPALSARQQKDRDLRGPSMDESYLSSLTPKAREAAGFVDVKESSANPFGMVTSALDQPTATRPASEEQKIRGVLSKLRISGLAGAPGSYRVLLGPLSVGEGEMLPRLFANQAEQLRVRSISERGLVLEFIDKEGGAQPRTIGLPFDLRPNVDSLLVGETFLKLVPLDNDGSVKLPPLMPDGVQAVLQGAKDEDLRSVVDRPTELLNAPAVLKSDEKPGR